MGKRNSDASYTVGAVDKAKIGYISPNKHHFKAALKNHRPIPIKHVEINWIHRVMMILMFGCAGFIIYVLGELLIIYH